MNRFLLILLGLCSAGVFAVSQTLSSSSMDAPSSSAESAGEVTDSSVAASSVEVPVAGNPFEKLEQIDPKVFQDVEVRYNRVKAASEDPSQSKNIRDFATAAMFFYKGDWENSYAAYDSLRGRDAFLDGSVILRMATAKFKLGEYAKMRETLALNKSLEKNAVWARQADLLRIQSVALEQGVSDKAQADSLKAFIAKYPKTDESAPFKYRYARYMEQFKNTKEAKKVYMQLLTSAAYKDSAFASIKRLRSERVSPESLGEKVAYAKIACGKEESSACLALLDSISILDMEQLKKKPESAVPLPEDSLQSKLPASTLSMADRIALWEKRATVLRNLGREDDAIRQYCFLVDSVEHRKDWIETALKRMRTVNSTKYAKTIRRYDPMLQVVSKYSKSTGDNLWRRGFDYEQAEKFDSALTCYKELSDKRYGKSSFRQWAKFRMGFVYFKQENWAKAESMFKEAMKENDRWSSSGARMFLGDSYMKQGKDSLAREAYLDCIRDFPLSSYAHRSRVKLLENKLMDSAQVPFAHGIEMSPEETLKWIRNAQNAGKADSSYSPERYERIKTLFLYGFSEHAFNLYDEARKKNAKRLDFLYEYGLLFYDMGEIAAGYRLARQFQANIDRRLLLEPPMGVLHYLYPTPFKEQVKFHAGDRIDPFFVYSVMRQESIFNFEIVSPAGACGLLQIMPSTGKMLAKQEGLAEFDPKQLYNPYLNIRLGTRYLVDLKATYKDDYMYVLGNYNAGPKPTKRWQAASGHLPWDIRSEEISYRETRDYVKRVMGNYWIYQEIYDKL